MARTPPRGELDPRFSSADAGAPAWAQVEKALTEAEIYWLSTVRRHGRPHVTPLLASWLDGALYFCTGEGEQKHKNLQRNPHCTLVTGCNHYGEGFDVVVEGDIAREEDAATLERLAGLWERKFDWKWTVQNGMFHGEEGNDAIVYKVAPSTVFGFGRGETYSQTRWRFQ